MSACRGIKSDRRLLPHWKFARKVDLRPLWILMLCLLPAVGHLIVRCAMGWIPDRRAHAGPSPSEFHNWVTAFLFFGGLFASIYFSFDPRQRLLRIGALCYACGMARSTGERACRACGDSFEPQDRHRVAVLERQRLTPTRYGGLPEPRFRLEWHALKKECSRGLSKAILGVFLPIAWVLAFGYLESNLAPFVLTEWLYLFLGISGLFALVIFVKSLVYLNRQRPEAGFTGRCLSCGTIRSEGIDRCWKCESDFAPQDAYMRPVLENLATRGRIQSPAFERAGVVPLLIVTAPVYAALGALILLMVHFRQEFDSADIDSWMVRLGDFLNSRTRALMFLAGITVAVLVTILPAMRIQGAMSRFLHRRLIKRFEGRCLFCGHALPAGVTVETEGRCASCDAGLARVERWRAKADA